MEVGDIYITEDGEVEIVRVKNSDIYNRQKNGELQYLPKRFFKKYQKKQMRKPNKKK